MNAKRISALLSCVALMAVVAVAEPPRDKGDGDRGDKGGRQKWDRERFRAQMENDWEEALAHFQAHSPLRAAAFSKMSEERQEFFKPLIIGRHRGIKWLSRDPELQKIKERQMKTEDDIFGLKQQLVAVDEDKEAAKLEAELRKRVEELVDERMLERSLRIDRLKMLVAEEEELLREDQFKRQSVIEKRLADILAAEVPVIDPPKMPEPPGDRRRGPEGERREK